MKEGLEEHEGEQASYMISINNALEKLQGNAPMAKQNGSMLAEVEAAKKLEETGTHGGEMVEVITLRDEGGVEDQTYGVQPMDVQGTDVQLMEVGDEAGMSSKIKNLKHKGKGKNSKN